MTKNNKETFKSLKKDIDLDKCDISLAIVKSTPRYSVLYVPINEPLENQLRGFISDHIDNTNTVKEYTIDCVEPDKGMALSINANETNFSTIDEKLRPLNPERNIIPNIKKLVQANAYIIIVRMNSVIKAIGFKKLPENWKMREKRGLLPLLFKGNSFESLGADPVFSIASTIDFIFYDEKLFIFSKNNFEIGLKYYERILQKADLFFKDIEKEDIFIDSQFLKDKRDNLHYARKFAHVYERKHYKDGKFLKNMETISKQEGWPINFWDGKIIVTKENVDALLSIFQHKRLRSDFDHQCYDAENTTPL